MRASGGYGTAFETFSILNMDLFDVYSLYDIEPVKGIGSKVYAADNTEYLDLYGGHAVISIGHSHPDYIKAITNQVSKLGFYSNSVKNSLQEKLAKRLGKACGYDSYALFLCNSGAEANENALKLASFATGRNQILAFDQAFHGRTFGAVAATDNAKIRAPFNETNHVTFAPLNDLESTKKLLSTKEYAAVIVEGIQGVAGIRMVCDGFIKNLREICNETGTLLILDEIQSGYGRTGRFFAHQHAGVKADIITCAKGIANGFPMGAVLISPAIEAKKGMLGTTFGGSHLACAAALSVLEVIENQNLIDNAATIGNYLLDKLGNLQKKYPDKIKEVRGRGLMIGIELVESGPEMRKRLLVGSRIFTGGAGNHTVRLLPALSLTKEDADVFLKEFESQLQDF